MPLDGVSDRTTPRKLFVRISKCAMSKMDIETRDVVTVPTYSMVSLVKYPVFNLSLDKHIFRYANIWDQILPDIFIRYALGTEPRVPHSKIVEIGRKNILNHNYRFPDYEALLRAGSRNVFQLLSSYTEAQFGGVLDRLEKVILEPYCHRSSADNYGRSALLKVKGSKYINLNTPLFYFYPSTYYPQPRATVSASDDSVATDFFAKSILNHLSRREHFAMYVRDQGKICDIHDKDINLTEKKKNGKI